MHHVALNRARADEGDLNDQIVEALRLEPRQHRHLRATLDLEHAHRVGTADHVEHAAVVGRYRSQCQVATVMLPYQVEAFANRSQHAERQHIHLQDAERTEVILVPLQHSAVGHGRILDRHQLRQRAAS